MSLAPEKKCTIDNSRVEREVESEILDSGSYMTIIANFHPSLLVTEVPVGANSNFVEG